MKNLLLFALFSLTLSMSVAWAQNVKMHERQNSTTNNYPVHVSDQLNNSEIMKKLRAKGKPSTSQQKSKLVVDEVGNERSFFVYNFTDETFISRDFRLMKKGGLTQIWFEITEIENGHLNEVVADSMFKYLEEVSNQYSFNPNKGIIELSNEYLGDPPDYDNDGLVDFLITDIKDGWSPDGDGGYTAGFFYGVDQHPDDQSTEPSYRSNERDILYIDSYPGIFSNDEADPLRPLGTLSHEYQHLIHYNYNSGFSSELTFIDEAQSNFASLLSGYFPHPSYSSYLADTNVPLFRWESGGNVFPDYGRAASFSSYMWDQLGFENSGSLTQNPLSGRAGITSTFTTLNAPFTFEEFLVNWGIANLINDKDHGETTGYEHLFLTNLRTPVSFEAPDLTNHTVDVENGGIEYFGFQQSKNFEIEVTADNAPAAEIRVITKTGNNVEINTLGSSQSFTTPSEELYDQLYIMLVNTNTKGGDEPLGFTLNVSGEQTYNLSTFSTYGDTPKFYWPIPYENDSGIGRFGFSNKYTIDFDALLHSLELFLVSGEDASTGGQIGVKGNGTLRIAVYTDNSGTPGEALAADSVDFEELGTDWQTFNVTDWELMLEEGEVIHIVYELIVPTVNRDLNSIPLRLDDGNGIQNVTHVVTAPGNFVEMFSDENTGGQHGVWNNLVLAESVVTSMDEISKTQPEFFKLKQNFPNPFNPTTNISFNLPSATDVKLTVYSILGQKVATLVNSRISSGTHSVTWDAQNMASGFYFYKIEAGDFVKTKKMLLVK